MSQRDDRKKASDIFNESEPVFGKKYNSCKIKVSIKYKDNIESR